MHRCDEQEQVVVVEKTWRRPAVWEVHVDLKRQVFDAGEDHVVQVAGQRAPDRVLVTRGYQVVFRRVDAGGLADNAWAVVRALHRLVDPQLERPAYSTRRCLPMPV